MAIIDQNALLRCKDDNGNEYLLYPITKLDCVDGAEDLVHFDKEQELTAVQKAQFLKNIGGLRAPESAQANQFLKVSAVDENGNVTAVETAAVEGGSGGTTEQVQSDWDETDTTSPAYIKNKPTISGDGSVSAQPDWLQNDPTQADYIKNRPFWAGDLQTTSFLEETTATFGYEGEVSDTQFSCSYEFQPSVESVELWNSNSDAITIKWDGVEYTCSPQLVDGAIFVGNVSLMLTGESTGEPFIIGMLEDSEGTLGMVFAISTIDSNATYDETYTETHTFQAYINEQEIQKMPLEYLYTPDWNTNDINSGSYIANRPFYSEFGNWETFMPSTTVPFKYSEENGGYVAGTSVPDSYYNAWMTDWGEVKVVFDGTEYICPPSNFMGYKACGDVDFITTGAHSEDQPPFVVVVGDIMGNGTNYLLVGSIEEPVTDDTGAVVDVTHTIGSFLKPEIIKTIDPKYISDVPWDKVSGKPFGIVKAGSVVMDETITCTAVGVDAISPVTSVNYDYIVNDTEYSVLINGVEYIGAGIVATGVTGIIVRNSSGSQVAVLVDVYNGFVPVSEDVFTVGEDYEIKITAPEDIVKQIPSEYIPDDIGGSELPDISTSGTDSGKVLTVSGSRMIWKTPASGLPTASSSDSGKVLTVSSTGSAVWTEVTHPVELPTVTTDDAGKFLRVGSGGTWTVAAIANAEEASF